MVRLSVNPVSRFGWSGARPYAQRSIMAEAGGASFDSESCLGAESWTDVAGPLPDIVPVRAMDSCPRSRSGLLRYRFSVAGWLKLVP